ncbi:MAG: 4-hydroxybutyrate dehydrogenase [Firmicutes bacterium]|nr:4-hydroxybutyrate dehydrogenase [Bacillota bacterium]
MKELLISPQIDSFQTFADFCQDFSVGSDDLILTNEYIYDPVMKKENLTCKYIFQEKYGVGEPTDLMVDKILKEMHRLGCERVIAVGGGTIIDIAKVLVLVGAVNVDVLFDKTVLKKEKELIVIPTTCGTGSEVTNLVIINHTRKGTKMGLGSPAMFADHAVLIPEFLKSIPYYVFATSSIDALIHAVESYLSPNRTDFTIMYSKAAIKAILSGYCSIVASGKDARFDDSEKYLKASTYAGIAFGNGGCAAVHAMSYALGGKYHVPHGESNYQFFTNVLRKYQKKKPDGVIYDLGKIIQETTKKYRFSAAMESSDGIEILEKLLAVILERKQMSDYGVTQSDIKGFAKSTVENQQRLLKNNYVFLTEDEIEAIYQERL